MCCLNVSAVRFESVAPKMLRNQLNTGPKLYRLIHSEEVKCFDHDFRVRVEVICESKHKKLQTRWQTTAKFHLS